jgi:hypothetical protein
MKYFMPHMAYSIQPVAYCRIGRSTIFGVILAFIVNGRINGRIRLNNDYPPWPAPMMMLRIGRNIRDAGKKDDRREYAYN